MFSTFKLRAQIQIQVSQGNTKGVSTAAQGFSFKRHLRDRLLWPQRPELVIEEDEDGSQLGAAEPALIHSRHNTQKK